MHGIEELTRSKLTDLIKIHLGTPKDAKHIFGTTQNVIAAYYDLEEYGLRVETQVPIPLVYKKVRQDVGFRMDILVENKVIIELKSIETLVRVHFAQTLTYLKPADKRLGLLINFNTKQLKNGSHRIVNN